MKQFGLLSLGLLLPVVLAACAGSTPTAVPTATASEQAAEAVPTTDEGVTVVPESEVNPPPGAQREFSTDFSRHTIDYSEVLSGGPSKDGIPAIDEPKFISISEADEWLEPMEPVISFQVGDDSRAYPIQILMWHEIVNDVVGGEPVVVTFCPLCNTAIAFDRTVGGQVLDFGTTGRLRFSNLIMYDRQTETWWQQATGEGIVGELAGTQLEFMPAPIVAWQDFKSSHPDGQVLSRDTGYSRSYGSNPYAGYDDVNNSPFLFRGPPTPDQLPPMARVLALEFGEDVVAFPYEVLEQELVVNETVGEREIAVFWQPGTASGLDTSNLAEGRDVGAANAFSRQLDDQTLTFTVREGDIFDEETGSRWNILGEAVAGPLEGSQLTEVVAVNHFWFSWVAFKPDTEIYQP